MESIREFLNKYHLSDKNLDNYDKDTIERLANILNGRITDPHLDNNSLKYAAIYYHYHIKDYKSAEKYYLIDIDNGYVSSMNSLGIMYRKQQKYEIAEKYFLMAIENGYEPSMSSLANLYYEQKRYELAEKYYLMAIEKGQMHSVNNLAASFDHQNQQQQAEKYYLIAIDINGDTNAMSNLARLYSRQNQRELADLYYLMAIDKGNVSNISEYIKNFIKYKKDDLKIYNALTKINNTNNVVVKTKMLELEKNYRIHCFKNRKIFLSKIDECPICFDTVLLIPFDCAHYMCCDCYVNIVRCPICRFPL